MRAPVSDRVSEGGPSPMSMSRTNQWRGCGSLWTGDPGVERVGAWRRPGGRDMSRDISPPTVLSRLSPEPTLGDSGQGNISDDIVLVNSQVGK